MRKTGMVLSTQSVIVHKKGKKMKVFAITVRLAALVALMFASTLSFGADCPTWPNCMDVIVVSGGGDDQATSGDFIGGSGMGGGGGGGGSGVQKAPSGTDGEGFVRLLKTLPKFCKSSAESCSDWNLRIGAGYCRLQSASLVSVCNIAVNDQGQRNCPDVSCPGG